MKFSANWLAELVPGLAVSPRELGQLITTKTAECEGVHAYAPFLDRILVARVVEARPIEGSKNVLAKVDAGAADLIGVVCGAPNCRAGLLTAYVPPETDLGNGRVIRTAKVSGHVSQGMLAGGDEIGVNRDHEGILELAEGVPGQALSSLDGRLVPDHIVEIDNKSLTHRPDLWGHHGMAREVAAITGLRAADPVKLDLLPGGAGPLRVEIEDYELCPRYSALVFENVTVGPSPLWLQYRLEAVGLNPISNIVDVTNLVMAELAQPTHAFDADLLKGETIYVRRARAGERVEALNGETYELDGQTVVIAGAGGAEAVAGVIGGRATGIHAGTRRVVLESANFQAASVRKTSARLKLRTDASMRFEKAQDARNTVRALARCLELFALVSPGIRVAGGVIDNAAPMREAAPIALPLDWLNRKIGREVEAGEVRRILEALEFGVAESAPRVFSVAVPSWRATKDISIPEDLVEEVGRMIGYETIPPRAPLAPAAPPAASPEREFHHGLRAQCVAQGFTEVHNYSFLSEERAARFGIDPGTLVRVLNPIASGQGMLRNSLVPGIARNIEDNARHFAEFRLFEIGNEIHKREEGLPEEIPHLAAAVYARHGDGEAGLFELKRLAEIVAPGASVERGGARRFEHPARAWKVMLRGEEVGRLFELHPDFCEGRGAVLDLDAAALFRMRPEEPRHRPLRRYPVSEFDLSVLAPARTEAAALEPLLREGADVVAVEFVRQFSGPPLEAGTKSVTFRVTLGRDDATLSHEEIESARARTIARIQAAGYGIRG
jgi:phenylalanyl-tRNA synthetase beta chain